MTAAELLPLIKAKGKELKLWNGRGYCCIKSDDPRWHTGNRSVKVSIAAYSRADAARLIEEYTGHAGRGLTAELRDYFSPMWGNSMEGITPERGIWAEFKAGKPERLI